jgi:hypothetical protein
MRLLPIQLPIQWRQLGHAVIVSAGLAVLSVSCQLREQGYWTKPGVSHALTNQQYPEDSKHCERLAEQDEGRTSESVRGARYTKCMYARGYEWVSEQPGSHPVRSAVTQPSVPQPCPTGRTVVDAFGYPKCVPSGHKDRGPDREVSGSVTRETPALKPERPAPPPALQSNDRWIVDDRECRRQAQETLSGPYGLYVRCMQEKGWP